MILKEKIDAILAPILSLDTWEDRMQYIIDLAKTIPEFPEYLKTADRKISGCQSNAWLDLYKEAGKVYISGYADSAFVRGFIHLLIKIYSRESSKDIREDQTQFMQQIGFQEMVNTNRSNGLLAIFKKIKNFN